MDLFVPDQVCFRGKSTGGRGVGQVSHDRWSQHRVRVSAGE